MRPTCFRVAKTGYGNDLRLGLFQEVVRETQTHPRKHREVNFEVKGLSVAALDQRDTGMFPQRLFAKSLRGGRYSH